MSLRSWLADKLKDPQYIQPEPVSRAPLQQKRRFYKPSKPLTSYKQPERVERQRPELNEQQIKQKQIRQEEIRQEQARVRQQIKQAAIWQEQRRQEKIKQEQIRQEQIRQEWIRQELSKPSTPSRTISSQTRMYVWQRDGGRCAECGSNEKLEYDHIIPVAKGGSNTERNVQLLCMKCNRKKHAKIM